MANAVWTGNALPVAQITDYLFAGTWEATDIVNVTCNGKTLAVTAGSTTISTIIDTIVTALDEVDTTLYPEFGAFEASRSSNTLRLTATQEGFPFAVTLSTTETGGGAADAQTIDGSTSSTGTTTTASAGPHHWDSTGNWSGAALPADGDTIIIDDPLADLRFGLNQTGITPATIHLIRGKVGLPRINAENAAPYLEYQTTHLTIGDASGSTTINVGENSDAPPTLFKLSSLTLAVTLNAYRLGAAPVGEVASLQWKTGTPGAGSNSIAIMDQGGDVAIAWNPSESAVIAGGINKSAPGKLLIGPGVTLTSSTIMVSAGEIYNNAAAHTVSLQPGDGVYIQDEGAVSQLYVRGGICWYNSTDTLGGNTIVAGRGVLRFDGNLRAKAVTNAIDLHGQEAEIHDGFKTVSVLVVDFNEGAEPKQCNFGMNPRLTRGSVA